MAHAISEMKRSGIELARRKPPKCKEAYGARRQRDEAERNRAVHGVNRRNARKHMAHAISEMKRSGIELARRKQK